LTRQFRKRTPFIDRLPDFKIYCTAVVEAVYNWQRTDTEITRQKRAK
jgi:hypothetical protein